MDVPFCEKAVAAECSGHGMRSLFLDDCGGHANPYHFHTDPKCDYSHAMGGHSPLIAISLDGYGIYGLYEKTETLPSLDACNGHVGPVPADVDLGVEANTD